MPRKACGNFIYLLRLPADAGNLGNVVFWIGV